MYATTATATAQPLTLASLERIVDAVAALPPDPLAQKMAADGFDPKAGGILILPIAMRTSVDWGPFGPPDYLRFSDVVKAPTYAMDPGLRLQAIISFNPLKANHEL